MGRLIDANKAIKDMQYYHDDCAQTSEYTRLGFETAMEVVKSASTVLTIPDNPTNGQMQLVLYPELEVRDFGSFVEAHSPNVELRVSKSWWNTPYKLQKNEG